MRDRLPPSSDILPELTREPIQEATEAEPFDVRVDDTTFTVTPLFTYDIVGLVVSEHNTDSLFDYYHKLWNDTFNVKDLCVVWGNNAISGLYKEMSFRSGSWTCYFKTRDTETWRAFTKAELSNNHLLTESPHIQKTLRSIRRGDQVRIKGYLAEYSHEGSFWRGSSISRTDTGNYACETIYITDIEVLREANGVWRIIFSLSFSLLMAVLALRVILFIVATARGPRRYI
jgi:hypothetical protein